MALGSDESDPEGIALHRHSYSRELKLAAIEWATNTYKKAKKEGDPEEVISRYAAARRLGITTTMLRKWIRNRAIIANQRRGSRRNRAVNNKGKEHLMEKMLFKEFQDARKLGKAVRCQWFQRHAKALYRQQYPSRVTQVPESGRLIYTGFKFSNRWF